MKYIKPHQFSFAVLFALSILHSAFVVALELENENEDVIEIKQVLQNIFFNECHYSGEVVLDVVYEFNSAEVGNIFLNGSLDGIDYFPILTKEVEKGSGQSHLVFEAGDCLQIIQIGFE